MEKRINTARGGRRRAVALIDRPGSPRPGGPYETSFHIFLYGDRADWQLYAWVDWFSSTKLPVYVASWRLLDAGCPEGALFTLLLELYVLPAAASPARPTARTALLRARKALGGLQTAAAVWRRRVAAPPTLGIQLFVLAQEITEFEASVLAVDGREVAELEARAQLTALVRASTGRWHDRDVGTVVADLLGHAVHAPEAAQAQWRRRNKRLVERFVRRYRRRPASEPAAAD